VTADLVLDTSSVARGWRSSAVRCVLEHTRAGRDSDMRKYKTKEFQNLVTMAEQDEVFKARIVLKTRIVTFASPGLKDCTGEVFHERWKLAIGRNAHRTFLK
jgi:hypothetical protein